MKSFKQIYRESKEVDGILKNTYTETEDRRKHITSLLQTVFDDLPSIDEKEIDNEMIDKRTTYFRGIPVVCELGQIPQYPTDVA